MSRLSEGDLKWLVELLQSGDLLELEVATDTFEVCLKAGNPPSLQMVIGAPAGFMADPAPAPVAAVAPVQDIPENAESLLSPMAGIFYRSSSPDAPPFASAGDDLQIGDTVGLIEAMKLYNEVTSHIHGRVIRFLVENEQHVEADQPLALLERLSP